MKEYELYGYWACTSIQFLTPVFLNKNNGFYYQQQLIDDEVKDIFKYIKMDPSPLEMVTPLTQKEINKINYDFSYYMYGYKIDDILFFGNRYQVLEFLKKNLVFLKLAITDPDRLQTIELFIKYMGK